MFAVSKPVAIGVALALSLTACDVPMSPSGAEPAPTSGPTPSGAAPDSAPGSLWFGPPVSAPVSDPFRLPHGPYGAGNRGIEYDTRPGTVVSAAAAGEVIFAGSVARTLHVTIDHGSGVVSSYSFLGRIIARIGARLNRGDTVGVAGERLHFGVRVDGAYVDPASFTAMPEVTVRLISGSGPARRGSG